MKGLVTNTITFSTVDGPGNRFVVFLQGCNFNCVACHNPYTINVCNDCGECVDTCPSGALTLDAIGAVQWNESACTGGDTCISVCPYDSTPKARYAEVADLVAKIRRAAPFLSGITVSGGEATQQTEFVHALFSAVKADQELCLLTCFVDSNGAAAPDTWLALSDTMDGAMIDLKCLDPEIHRTMTGQPNDMVLASIHQLHAMGLLYEVRLLLLAGINDDPALLRSTAAWLADIDPEMRVKVIGFRNHGVRPHDPPLIEPSPDSLHSAAELLFEFAQFDVCVI
ncbi:MAG: YjjW family glycine radical enzyme activase [Actinomycetia bacterium]|nr:YjjW family glycine radical enzyme activase [Actinomycetes bacterium]